MYIFYGRCFSQSYAILVQFLFCLVWLTVIHIVVIYVFLCLVTYMYITFPHVECQVSYLCIVSL